MSGGGPSRGLPKSRSPIQARIGASRGPSYPGRPAPRKPRTRRQPPGGRNFPTPHSSLVQKKAWREPLPDPREVELIARLRSRDLEALAELYKELGGVMLTLARSMMGDKDEADDVVEDALIRIHQAAPGFRGERGLRTWTLRIVANLCRDRLRRAKFKAGDPEEMDPLAHAGLVVHPTAGWDRDLDLERQLAALEKALAALPHDQREAVILRDRLELSYEDAAATIGISVAALKSRLFRARETLRSRLGEERKGT